MSAAILMVERSVLVFDLDGTLIDSVGDIAGTLDLALADCGLHALAARQLLDLYSPLEDIVRGLLRAGSASPGLADEVVSAYRRRLAQSSYDRSAPYPGVLDFLRDSTDRGQRLAVCTNKRRGEALRMLAHFGMLGFFDCVVGADSAVCAKPHAAPLRMVLESMEVDARDALLVGDTHVDALCARNGGVDFVWHRSGYGGEEVNQQAMAASFDSFEELRAIRKMALIMRA